MPIAFSALAEALQDRYTFERELGRGGMATVYLARDLRHDRLVALKVLHPELAASLGPERFLREIDIAARLQHPLILPVFDSGAAESLAGAAAQCLWYAMPFVEGESLRDRLRWEQQLSIEDALRITREVADALGYAHAQGIVHRDIKPANILLAKGHAFVADFGIARALDAAGGEKLTETGFAVGTPGYMSPEQAAATRRLDARTDIYSLGCVLYEMLAGQPPFTGPTAQAIMARHAIDPVPRLRTVRPTVPAAVEGAISKALAKVPGDRYPTLREFAAALDQAASPAAPQGRRRRARWAILGVALTLVLLLMVGLNARAARQRAPGSPAPVRIQSLAVLPLENLSGDSLLGDAMTEALTTDLGRISALRVTSRTAVMRYKGSTLSAPQIARDLGVDAVLEGGVQRSGDSLRLDLRLISAATGYQVWAQRFDEGVAKRFAIEDAISRSLVSTLKLSVTSSEERSLRIPPTTNAEAYDDFLRGKIHARTETPSENSIAIGLLEQAVALDPGFAAAYAELAHAYGLRVFYYTPGDGEARDKALVAAEKALQLDPELAEAHFARGFLLWTPANHFAHEQAIQEYRRAIALNPNLANAHDQLGVVYWHIGLFDKALGEFRKVMTLDPGNRLAQHRFGTVFVYQGRYEEGLRILRQIPREFNPSLVTYHLAWTLVLSGRNAEASTVIEDYLRTDPQDPGGLVTSVRAILDAKAGNARAMEQDIARVSRLGLGFIHSHHAAYNVASAYALLRKPGPAIEWLRRAVNDGLPCYPLLAKDPNLDNLRQNPAFVALMSELKAQWERWQREL